MRSYTCHRCDHRKYRNFDPTISTGEEYDAEIWVGDGGWETRRFHRWCPEDDPWGDFDWGDREHEKSPEPEPLAPEVNVLEKAA